MQLKLTTSIKLSTDSGERQDIYERLQDATSEVVSAFAFGNSRVLTVPAQQTLALSLANITTVKFLYLETNAELLVRLNNGAESFKVTPQGTVPGRLLMLTDSITALTLINNGAVLATATLVLAGS